MSKAIEKLEKIDLSHRHIANIAKIISEVIEDIVGICFLLTYYNKSDFPKIIERAVQNDDLKSVFKTVERISYTLPEWNTVYKRASTPTNSMFYGSPTIEEYGEKMLDKCRITISCEACDLLRKIEFSSDDNVRHMTFGQWEVEDTLNLLTIIDPTKNYTNSLMIKLQKNYLSNLERHPELKASTLEYMTFMANEFAKPVSEGSNHEYLISALFTERFTKGTGFDGVIYPSVKADEIGLCIAIYPEAVKKIKLIQVSEYELTRHDDGATILLTKRCDVDKDATTFQLLNIDEYNKSKK